MKVIDINVFRKNGLKDRILGEEVVVLVGSGISIWAPSNLPSGKRFVKDLFRVLFYDNCGRLISANEETLVNQYFSLPFEVINESCPNENKIRDVLKRLFNSREPNPIHLSIAEMVEVGFIHSIITPNYDCCLDASIEPQLAGKEEKHLDRIIKIVSIDDVADFDIGSKRLYFKIHGTTDDSSGNSLIFRLSQEGVLDPWKRKVFRQSVEGKILLVIGYSGSDFDICPEIPLAKPKMVIWNIKNFKKDEIPHNLKFVDSKVNTTFLKSDMRDLVGELNHPLKVEYDSYSVSIEGIIREEFTDEELKLWRTRLYNNFNYNRSALYETEKFIAKGTVDSAIGVEFLSQHGGALASHGHYRQAAKSHSKAAIIAREIGLPEDNIISQYLFASDAWRCYGDFVKAIGNHLKAQRLEKRITVTSVNIKAGIFRNEILMIQHLYEIFKRSHLNWFANKIQARVRNLLREIVEVYRGQGQWYPLQQMELWSVRFDLPKESVISYGEYETPPSIEGYKQLNFPMGEMMAFRQGIDGGKTSPSRGNARNARRLAKLAKELGINPEIWKLHLIILRKFKKDRDVRNDVKEFICAFKYCEYSPIFRVWRLILGR